MQETKIINASKLAEDMLIKWLYWKKGHRKARWLKKWARFAKRCEREYALFLKSRPNEVLVND